MKIRWAFKIMEVLNQYFMFVLYYLFFLSNGKAIQSCILTMFQSHNRRVQTDSAFRFESLNTSLSLFFLSNIVTFLIFLNMSTLASHALFTPSEILLRSNGGRNVFFMFQFEKSPWQCLSSHMSHGGQISSGRFGVPNLKKKLSGLQLRGCRMNRWTLVCHLVFLSTLATFLIFSLANNVRSMEHSSMYFTSEFRCFEC